MNYGPVQKHRAIFMIKTAFAEKESILDIKVLLSSGELIDIEMQVGHLDDFRKRAIFYSGKLINESLQKGEHYDKMKVSMVLNIVDATLFPEYEKAFSTYYYKEDLENTRLDTIAQIKFLELGKIDIEAKPVSEMTMEERLGAYLKYAAIPEKAEYMKELLAYESEVISLTKPILEYVSTDDEMREIMEARLKYELDYNTSMHYAEKRGREEGRGMALVEFVCKKLQKGKSVGVIAEELDEDISVIETICKAAKAFAPDYDSKAVYLAWKK